MTIVIITDIVNHINRFQIFAAHESIGIIIKKNNALIANRKNSGKVTIFNIFRRANGEGIDLPSSGRTSYRPSKRSKES